MDYINKLIQSGDIPQILPYNQTIQELREEQIVWWKKSIYNSELPERRKKWYTDFLQRVKNKSDLKMNEINSSNSLGEICGGPWGGLLHTHFKHFPKKYQIDLLADKFEKLALVNQNWVVSPSEKINMEDNFLDYLFGFNSLDHGWDIKKSINECIRVSKKGAISFDINNHINLENYPNKQHYQLVETKNVLDILHDIENKYNIKITHWIHKLNDPNRSVEIFEFTWTKF